jgi:hypothetical protein
MKVQELSCSTARQPDWLLALLQVNRPNATPDHRDAALW